MLRLDPTTRAAYNAGATAEAKVTAVLNALVAPVTVKVLNGNGNVMGSGTMADPWATVQDNVLTMTSVTAFTVTTGGTPDSSWRIRFESGDRWLEGSFGLVNSSQEFIWSLPTWETGQEGRIGDATAATWKGVADSTINAWFSIVEVDSGTLDWNNLNPVTLPDFTEGVGGTYDLKQDANIPEGTTPNFTVVSTPISGVVVDPLEGLLRVDPATPSSESEYEVVVSLLPSAPLVDAPTLVVSEPGPWTTGQSFKKGAISTTYTAASSGQAEVRNWWNDGSVKFAVVSGIGPQTVTFAQSTTSQMGSGIAEPSVQASVTLAEFNSGQAIELSTARSNGLTGWQLRVPHKIREIRGPVMSEFHYYAPVPGYNRLSVRWFVRAYSNGSVEVDTWIESGFAQYEMNAANVDTYTVTVRVNNAVVYGPTAVTHRVFQRWGRIDWIGTAPTSHVVQDFRYLKATKVVPNLTDGTPNEAMWNQTTSSGYNLRGAVKDYIGSLRPTPITRGIWRLAMNAGGEGDADQIGIITHHDGLFLVAGDEVDDRPKNTVLAAARQLGYYTAHYRDATTGLPILLINNNSVRVSTEGVYDEKSDDEHPPSWGYLAYLLSGRWPFVEGMAMQYASRPQAAGPNNVWPDSLSRFGRSGTKGLWGGTERAVWWMARACGQAIMCMPENDPDYLAIRNEFQRHFDNNIAAWWSVQDPTHPYAIPNNIGVLIPANGYNDNIMSINDPLFGTTHAYGPWQKGYGVFTLLHLYEAEVPVSNPTTWENVVRHAAMLPVGMLGLASRGGFSWKRANSYAMAYGTRSSATSEFFGNSVFSTWADLYAFNMALSGPNGEPPPQELESDGINTFIGRAGVSNNYFYSTTYEPNSTQRPPRNVGAVAIAVDLDVPGALSSWYQYIASDWYQTKVSENYLATYPRYMILPR